MADWLTQLKKAKKSCIKEGIFKKIHYELEDGRQMVEEYNVDTGVLSRRAWKYSDGLSSHDNWEIEIGDPEPTFTGREELGIQESVGQPSICRRNTRSNLEWRIRNLPYSIDTYSVTADSDQQCLVVRTTNKKYYKIIPVPDLARLNIKLDQFYVSFTHKFNTLIILYKKPHALLEFEKALYSEIKNIEPKHQEELPDCRPS